MKKMINKKSRAIYILILLFLFCGSLIILPPALQAQTTDTTGTGTTDTTGAGTVGGNDCDLMQESCPTPNPPTERPSGELKSVSEMLKYSNIANAWALSLDVVNVIAIFALLAIAFANILHIDVETWNFKRMIPALILGIIAANLSHLICRAVIDFAGMLMAFFIPPDQAQDTIYQILIGMWGGWVKAAGPGGIAGIFLILFGAVACAVLPIVVLIMLVPGIIVFILWAMLGIREFILWFLVIVAPIAFFGFFIPPMKKLVEKWTGAFFTWTFMGPIAYFFLYLAAGFARDETMMPGAPIADCFLPASGDQVGGFVKFLFVNALLLMAVIVPYVIGGKVFGYAWKYVGQYAAKAGAYGAGSFAQLGIRAQGALTKATLGRIPGRAGKFFGSIGESMAKAPHPIAAYEGAKMFLENRQKAAAGEAETSITNLVRRKIAPGALRTQARDDILKVSSDRARDMGVQQLVEMTHQGLGLNDEKLMGTGLHALAIKAQSSRSADERKQAIVELHRMGVTLDQAHATPFKLGDRKGATETLKRNRGKILDDKGKAIAGYDETPMTDDPAAPGGERKMTPDDEKGYDPNAPVINVRDVPSPSSPPARPLHRPARAHRPVRRGGRRPRP